MAAVGPRHKGMSLAAAAAPADVLTQLFQLCLAHTTSSADTLLCLARLRLVCKHWRDCVDGLELEEAELNRVVVLPRGLQEPPRPPPRLAAYLGAALRTLRKLSLRAVCQQDGQPYLGATLLLTASVLAAAPGLEQLRLHLPAGLAQRLDSVANWSRRASLRRLHLVYDPPSGPWQDDPTASSSAHSCLWKAEGLESLALSLPSGCQLLLSGLVLPRHITQLDAEASDSRESNPQNLASLWTGCTRLERLRLHNIVSGQQLLPPEFSRLTSLTSLDLRSDYPLGLAHASLAALLPQLRRLDLHTHACTPALGLLSALSRLRCWGRGQEDVGDDPIDAVDDAPELVRLELTGGFAPRSLGACTQLTRLDLMPRRAHGAAELGMAVPNLSRLSDLRHLRVARSAAPSLSEWLPSLEQLTCLVLLELKPEYLAGLDLSGQQVLRQLVMNKCGLRRVPAGLTQLTALSCADLRLNPELLLTLTEGKWSAAHGLITDSWD